MFIIEGEVDAMGTHAADISIEFDTPSIGLVTFTALNESEVEFLRWMAEDLVGGMWDGRSLTLALEASDTVFQTGLMNGLGFSFQTGETIQLPPDALYDVDKLVAQVDVMTQLKRLDSEREPD